MHVSSSPTIRHWFRGGFVALLDARIDIEGVDNGEPAVRMTRVPAVGHPTWP